MVPRTKQLPRYPVDDIMEPTTYTLQVPFGRAQRKKEVAQGVALPSESGVMYGGKPIRLTMIMGKIQDAFKSTDPKMVKLPPFCDNRTRLPSPSWMDGSDVPNRHNISLTKIFFMFSS